MHFVPGLLQTEAYARAVIQRGMTGAVKADIDRSVALRLERQTRFFREEGPELRAVLDEAVVRRPQGDREVMRSQIQHLVEASEWEHMRLQIVPFRSGGHCGESGAFSILSFPEPDLSDVVYVEQLTSSLYLDKRWDVAQYDEAMSSLRQDSLSPDESRDLLRELLQQP